MLYQFHNTRKSHPKCLHSYLRAYHEGHAYRKGFLIVSVTEQSLPSQQQRQSSRCECCEFCVISETVSYKCVITAVLVWNMSHSCLLVNFSSSPFTQTIYTRHNTLGAKISDTFRYGVGEGRRWGVEPIVFSIWSSVANSPLLYHWWRQFGVCPVGYPSDTSCVSGLPEATRLARRGNHVSLHKFFIVTSCCNKISLLRFCLPVIGVLDPFFFQDERQAQGNARATPDLTA